MQHFVGMESKIEINKRIINQVTFKITDQDGKAINIGDIHLDLYIM